MELCMKIYSLLLLLFCHCHGKDTSDHPGHLQPFGVGLKTMSVETRTDFPDPIEFFDSYIARSKPVIFKGMAKSFPQYNNLRNDTYLGETYGKWNVTYEPNTKEIREKVFKRMSFKKFTKSYSKNKFYMVADIISPNPLRREVSIPKPLLCDDLAGRMETCIMWFSSGGTRSLLHSDSQDNLNCLYDGVKELYIAHPKHEKKFYYGDGTSFSEIDMDSVDYEKFPDLLRVPWYYVKLEAGDCLYIPYTWVHQIKSHGPRNFAINLFWDRMLSMPGREKCRAEIKSLGNTEPLTNYYAQDKFERARTTWVAKTFGREKDNMTKDRVCNAIIDEHEISLQKCEEFLYIVDKNKDEVVSFDELYQVDIKHVKPWISQIVEEEEDLAEVNGYEEVDPKAEKDADSENKKEEL